MTPLRVAAYTLVNALGAGIQASLCALREGRNGLRPCDFDGARLDTWIGRVEGIEGVALPEHLAHFDCRNNRLAYMGLIQDGFSQRVAETRVRYGAHRVGVFVGTSTSGMAETEKAYSQRHPNSGALPETYRYRYTQNTFSVADFTRRFLGLGGPAQAVATACSSSAKVFAVAHRHIVAGLCDAAVVGGVESVCLTTLHGF
ncbi:MAG: beta-ketoacyl synthase N-terminal-like domain-containing protein, partial [Gammaproteobacteria bacterium]